jgi:hypothetical protein
MGQSYTPKSDRAVSAVPEGSLKQNLEKIKCSVGRKVASKIRQNYQREPKMAHPSKSTCLE